MDNAEASTSRTRSLDIDFEQDTSSRWIKRLKISDSCNHSISTKSLSLDDSTSDEKANQLVSNGVRSERAISKPVFLSTGKWFACFFHCYCKASLNLRWTTSRDSLIGKILEVLKNWPEKKIQVIVVTDGERILGLEDLGCQGMGIPVGKLSLYTALGGIRPSACLPVTIDVGTNNEKLLNDDFYIGLRQRRAHGQEYAELLNEFMSAVKQKYGEKVLIQFEDFANHNAFDLLAKYGSTHLVFNDDIQGTASVVLSGIMAALKLVGGSLAEQKFLFLGAGEAGTGIAELIALEMSKQTDIPLEETRKNIWLVNSKGLIIRSRYETLQHFKKPWAHEHEPVRNIVDAVKATPRLSEDKVKQCVDTRLNGEYPPKAVAKIALHVGRYIATMMSTGVILLTGLQLSGGDGQMNDLIWYSWLGGIIIVTMTGSDMVLDEVSRGGPRNIVITGSTRGLGKALAREFLLSGDRVVVASRSLESVEKTIKELEDSLKECLETADDFSRRSLDWL